MIGIYLIENLKNNKKYVGQSVCIERRWAQEKRMKRLNEHLLRSMQKYGIENFEFSILEECKAEELNEKEKFYIEKFETTNPKKGYNKTSGGDSAFKRVFTPCSEHRREAVRKANTGKKYPPRPKTQEELKLLREHSSCCKKVYCYETGETFQSFSEAYEKLGVMLKVGKLKNRGQFANGYHFCLLEDKDTIDWDLRTLSEKCSDAKKGKAGHPCSEETKKKISLKNKGRVKSEEERRRLSEINKGKKHSEETKRKISQSQIGMKRKEGTGENISKAKLASLEKNAKYKIVCIETNDEALSSNQLASLMREKYNCKVNKKGILNSLKTEGKSSSDNFHFKKVER